MTVTEQLKARYSNRGTAPLSMAELIRFHGRKWATNEEQWAEFRRCFVLCRDGIVRTR